MSDDRAPSGYQRQQQEAAMKAIVEALLRGIDLRKWCVEKALERNNTSVSTIELAEKIHAFVTADVKSAATEDEP